MLRHSLSPRISSLSLLTVTTAGVFPEFAFAIAIIQSNDFIKSLTSYDINILTETWGCSHEFDIPQFEKKVILPSKLKGRKSGRSSGGIIILYKSHLKSKIEFNKICPNYL